MRIALLQIALFLPALGAALGADAPPVETARPVKTLDDLVSGLKDPDPAIRVEAAKALWERGPKALPAAGALVEALEDKSADVRVHAAFALAKIGPEASAAVGPLARLLEDDTTTTGNVPVWLAASMALGGMGPEAVPELIPVLKSSKRHARQAAAGAIYLIGPPAKDAVPSLIVMLADEHKKTARVAMHALMSIGPESRAAVPSLVEALSSDDFHSQYTACMALGGIGPDAVEAVPELVRVLKEGSASARRHSAAALGSIGPEIGDEAVERLIEALADQAQPVREKAVIALGMLGPAARSAVPVIEKALDERTIAGRVAAAKAHWQLTGRTDIAVPILIDELDTFEVTLDAVEALAEIGAGADVAVGHLNKLLETDDEETIHVVTDALEKIDPK